MVMIVKIQKKARIRVLLVYTFILFTDIARQLRYV